MKKSEFIFVGMLTTIIAIIIMSACGSPSSGNAESKQMTVEYDSRTTPITIEDLGDVGSHRAYIIKKDGVEYIALVGRSTQGGTTIIKHEPVEKEPIALDTSGGWLDEYEMLGYRKARPSIAGVTTLTQPDVRRNKIR